MNELFVMLGIESWKPALTALVLPPVPLVLMVLVGGRVIYKRRALGWLLLLLGAAGTWLMCTTAVGNALQNMFAMPPRVLNASDIGELKQSPKTAIVVLGGGRRDLSPEYGLSNLHPRGVERLRYGIWLARETGLPMAFSGGVGFSDQPGTPEAEIAARIAEREFGHKLRWTETQSRDTNENARGTLPIMKAAGIDTIVLVTHDYHMRRSLEAFDRAAKHLGITVKLIPAPMGADGPFRMTLADWLPSRAGYASVSYALHEGLGRLAGA